MRRSGVGIPPKDSDPGGIPQKGNYRADGAGVSVEPPQYVLEQEYPPDLEEWNAQDAEGGRHTVRQCRNCTGSTVTCHALCGVDAGKLPVERSGEANADRNECE